MGLDARAESVREPGDRALETVVEPFQAAALTADEVVMVLTGGVHGLGLHRQKSGAHTLN